MKMDSFTILGFVASALLGGLVATIFLKSQPHTIQGNQNNSKKSDHNDDHHTSSSSSSSSNKEEDTNTTRSHNENEGYKMVLVVRNDLGMGKGKIAAQCSHATLGAYKTAVRKKLLTDLERWEYCGQAKVVLKCDSEEELLGLEDKAKKEKINNYLIMDAGKTQIDPGTLTVLSIGPAPKQIIDKITGRLKLM